MNKVMFPTLLTFEFRDWMLKERLKVLQEERRGELR